MAHEGSVGAWAAEFAERWGVVKRGVYGNLDLTTYNEARCRSLGSSGVPADVEAEAKLHPVKAKAMVQTGEQGWAALRAGKPVAICSNRGFTTVLNGGFCEPSGVWNHCMLARGVLLTKRGRAVPIQNSWGGYLNGERRVELANGQMLELPEGCFCAAFDVFDSMLRQNDSWAFAGLSGWKANRLTWVP